MSTIIFTKGFASRPYFLSDPNQLPELLQDPSINNLCSGGVIEGIFVIPSAVYPRGFGWRQNPLQALVFCEEGICHIKASKKKGKQPELFTIFASDILWIKMSLILLYGKLEICGFQNGQPVKIEVEYQTVSQHLLSPVLHKLIQKTWQKSPAGFSEPEPDESFADFIKISYSFYNGLRLQALQPGEVVQGFVYQPEIRERRRPFFTKKCFPQTVAALTNRQLTLLQQDLKLRTHHEWIFTFVPLHRIAQVAENDEKNWKKYTLFLGPPSSQQKIELLLEFPHVEKWGKVWEYLKKNANQAIF